MVLFMSVIKQGYSSMVEQRSPTPLVWVRVLLPLPIYTQAYYLVGFFMFYFIIEHTKHIQIVLCLMHKKITVKDYKAQIISTILSPLPVKFLSALL